MSVDRMAPGMKLLVAIGVIVLPWAWWSYSSLADPSWLIQVMFFWGAVGCICLALLWRPEGETSRASMAGKTARLGQKQGGVQQMRWRDLAIYSAKFIGAWIVDFSIHIGCWIAYVIVGLIAFAAGLPAWMSMVLLLSPVIVLWLLAVRNSFRMVWACWPLGGHS